MADAMQASRKNAGCSQPFNHFPRSRPVGKKRKEGCHAFLIESGTSSTHVGGVLCHIGRAISSVCFFDHIHRVCGERLSWWCEGVCFGMMSEGKVGSMLMGLLVWDVEVGLFVTFVDCEDCSFRDRVSSLSWREC